MNIVVIGQTYLKEINRDKFNILAQKGYNISLVVMKKRYDTLFTTEFDPSKNNQLHTYQLPVIRNGKEPLYFFSLFKFARLLKTLKPDIIHIDNPTWSFVLLQVLITKCIVASKAKVIVFTRLNLPYPKHPKFWLYRLIELVNIRNIDALICGNNDWKNYFAQRWFKKPIFVLPQLGVDMKFFVKKDVSRLREKYLLKPDNFVFGSIGRIIPEKGLDDILIAFQKVVNQHPTSKLLLVGKGPYKSDLEQLAQDLQINDSIIRVESVTHEEVVNYINLCDVHILASYETPEWKEQFGHILIECMSAGVPVIGSDSGEIPNVIGETWGVFKARDVIWLINQMEKMLTDNTYRVLCIEKWLHRVEEHYTHEKIAQALEHIYQQISN